MIYLFNIVLLMAINIWIPSVLTVGSIAAVYFIGGWWWVALAASSLLLIVSLMLKLYGGPQ